MSLIRDTNVVLQKPIAAIAWLPLTDAKDAHPAGQAHRTDSPADGRLTFVLTQAQPVGAGVVASHAISMPQGPALLRVDEVCFPVGAIAHRHMHTGTGIRHLVRGALRIEADDHTQIMHTGDSWFEAAHAPVRAVALQTNGVTSFVRCMVVPIADQGQSTFRLIDPAEAALRRLQMTHRHMECPVQVDAG